MTTDPLVPAPDWFVDDFYAALIGGVSVGDRDSAAYRGVSAYAQLLWTKLEARGWQGHRLLGGERLADGSLSKAEKIPTLILPRPSAFVKIKGV